MIRSWERAAAIACRLHAVETGRPNKRVQTDRATPGRSPEGR